MPKLGVPSLVALVALVVAAPAHAQQLAVADFTAEVIHADGEVFELAGGHPYAGITAFEVATDSSGAPTAAVKDVRVDIPPGLVPNPRALPQCTDAQLELGACPVETQVGTEDLRAYVKDPLDVGVGVPIELKLPLYNMTTGPEQVARFAFNPADAIPLIPAGPVLELVAGIGHVEIIGGVRDSGDFGMFFTISDIAESAELVRTKLTFWGVPADPVHDAERDEACFNGVCSPLAGAPSTAPRTAFLTNPTRCDGVTLETRLRLESHDGQVATASDFTPTGPNGEQGPQHCDELPFDPSIAVAPDTTQPDAPTGPLVTLGVPQDGLLDPDGRASAHVEDVTVTLPPGLTMNPSSANGLEACSDEQLGAGSERPVACPEASRLGSVTVESPPLAAPLQGSIHLGRPLPGERYRLFLTAEGQGISVRLKGVVRPDPATGQLTTSFEDNPQVPFETFVLDFRDGPRAPLATPLECGPKQATSRFVPHSGTPAATPSSAPFEIGPGCPSPFAPSFGARSASSLAGAFSPFAVSFARPDGHRHLSRIAVETPPGLLGMVSQVPLCPDAQAARGACGVESRIGTVTVRSGAGPEPFGLSGPVYLTGPYGGGPFGMSVAIRALAGPFDLGTVVVRQAIFVDPIDAHLRVVSDPLPTILEGIPLRVRSIDVDLDRPGFVANPTSCGTKQVRTTLGSTDGATSTAASALEVGGCERLGLDPKLALTLTGRKQTRDGGHPGLKAVLTQSAGQSNLRRVTVKLPLSLALDPENARSVCGFEQGLAGNCPAETIIGQATAVSPALNRPLSGPVHFVQGIRIHPGTGARIRTLPTLFVPLRGEVAIDLRATTAVERGKLVSTFDAVPDAPVSRFELALTGGRNGILAVTGRRGLCNGRHVANALIDGHNGKSVAPAVAMRTPCAKPPGLRLGELRWGAKRLTVAGRTARTATAKLRVSLRCGRTAVTRAARPKRGRWKVGLPLRGRCASARRAKLTVRHPGGHGFSAATLRRTLERPR